MSRILMAKNTFESTGPYLSSTNSMLLCGCIYRRKYASRLICERTCTLAGACKLLRLDDIELRKMTCKRLDTKGCYCSFYPATVVSTAVLGKEKLSKK